MEQNDLFYDYLAAPKLWLKNRLVKASQLKYPVADGWFLTTESGEPFCYILEITNQGIDTYEKKIHKIINGLSGINLAVLMKKGNSPLSYKWDFLKNKVIKYVGKFDHFKEYDKGIQLRKTGFREGSNDLKPIDNKIENTIFQIHSILRDVDALHPDTALDEICKLLYVKLYDEEITRKGEVYKFQRSKYSTVEECAFMIRQLYQQANEHDTRVFSLRIPGYKRSRGVFDSPILLSSEAISKVVEHIQSLTFTQSDSDLKGKIFQNLISPVLRGGYGQYFTPSQVVDFIVDLVKPSLSELIIDPFAGSGHFLTSSIKYVKKTDGNVDSKRMNDFLFTHLHGMEISDRMVRISMTDMRLHGDGHSNIRCVDALLDFSNYQDLNRESFDIVMTNPPFGSLVNSANTSKLDNFFLAKDKKNCPLEILGLERSVQLLRTGGRMAIVLPDSIFVNSNLKYVRDWILNNICVIAIISLPIETFSPYGANIKTSILLLKKERDLEESKKRKVFIAQVNNVGYDAAGRVKPTSEFDQLAKDFNKFLKKEKISWQ